MAFLLTIISALGAVIGGLLALGSRGKLNLTLGFTAGALLGLVAFDLLPEIVELSEHNDLDLTAPMAALVAGFLLFHTIEKFILIHHSHEERYVIHQHPQVGMASAVALISHSFLDGMSIGLAFQVNSTVGIAVAVAVIAHRFADGFNAVNLMLLHKNSRARTVKTLAFVAAAPVAGYLATRFFSLPDMALIIYLGFFAGFVLYISASDILPQAHSRTSSRGVILLTVLGAVFMYVITQAAQGLHLD